MLPACGLSYPVTRFVLQVSFVSSSVGVRFALLLGLTSSAAASIVAAHDPLPSPIGLVDHSSIHSRPILTVNTTAQLRDALERPDANGRVALYLPEGNVYRLNGTQLQIRGIQVLLWSEGAGATLDAQGLSHHFVTSLGGQMHLHRVHTRGVMVGLTHDHMLHG